ncbi:unnamed protein product [Prunus armeniaca]|uniref:Uncharacterized protein n=1 Tax=Prunus armeniaca TaxID=36596 RepID=A0A6J5U589_PRUAR|nr:unnamed protein product [Prunus armeniaca]
MPKHQYFGAKSKDRQTTQIRSRSENSNLQIRNTKPNKENKEGGEGRVEGEDEEGGKGIGGERRDAGIP